MTTLADPAAQPVLHTGWFQALAAFVAINTLIYAALASPSSSPDGGPSRKPPATTTAIRIGWEPKDHRPELLRRLLQAGKVERTQAEGSADFPR